MNAMDRLDRKLRARLLLEQRVEDDRLALDDATLLAALAGTAPLTPAQAAALKASPLTLRRFRQLALERRQTQSAASDRAWRGSGGMLRAAAHGALARLATDDGWWSLHFVRGAAGWHSVLQLDPLAPFAAALLRERAQVRVTDGAGALVLGGALDADGELEAAWPFADAPAVHFQRQGARFMVQPGAA